MAQVTSGPTPKKTFHLARDLAISILVVIAVAAFFVGWALGKHNQTSSSGSNSSNMQAYKSQENGFQLNYPNDWQSPTLSKTTTNSTTMYLLSFIKSSSGD